MADVTVVANDVEIQGACGIDARTKAGETLTPGQAVYLKTDGKYWKADAGAILTASAVGITLTDAIADQEVVVARSGKVDLGATLTVGTVYVVSGTAGGIAPVGDTPSSEYLTILGWATAADELLINIVATGQAIP